MIARAFAVIAIPLFWFAVGATFYATLSPVPPMPPGAPSDKVQHFVAFATLTVLAIAAYPRAKWQVLLPSLIAFGALIECVQAIPALHRSPEWLDLAADSGAVIAVLLVMSGVKRVLAK
ncbi:MAG: hypothetical protein ABL909_04230 [Sphingopyxis sp.]